jgi:hypothetical protein
LRNFFALLIVASFIQAITTMTRAGETLAANAGAATKSPERDKNLG